MREKSSHPFSSNNIHRARYECFGGIISYEDPPMLAWVDRDFMTGLGYVRSDLWNGPVPKNSDDADQLSAPTEVHFAVTNRCSMGCDGCYLDSRAEKDDDRPLDAVKAHLKTLAGMGVFHVALGGGEAFEREDFGEIVAYCRGVGLVPNCTTNGQNVNEREVAICRNMGQVNVSIDGVHANYGINGRKGSFTRAEAAIVLLKEAGVNVGINCVVSRKNFHMLEEVVRFSSERGCSEVEFLKYKPSGRGCSNYGEFRLDQTMIRSFYHRICKIMKRYRVELKIDCSFIPAMAHALPPPSALKRLGVTGCDAGNILLAVRSRGVFSGCSFVNNNEPLGDIVNLWRTSQQLIAFRKLVVNALEPCRSCNYLSICRCGCRAVALYETGNFFAPDPECPRVYDFNKKLGQNAHAKGRT